MDLTAITVRILAPRPIVYRALLDPDAVARWMVPDGMTSHVHEFDVREGGSFRISLTYDPPTGKGKTSAQTDTFHGRFIRLLQDWQIVQAVEFETSDPTLQGEMTITYDLVYVSVGIDLLAVHRGLPPGLSRSDNDDGWRASMKKLKRLIESGYGPNSQSP
jgi:uncharacterized protein YndB with AHSA1/START domain